MAVPGIGARMYDRLKDVKLQDILSGAVSRSMMEGMNPRPTKPVINGIFTYLVPIPPASEK
jgi:hypothetical protein